MTVSRRSFVGGLAAALGYLKVGPEVDLFAQAPAGQRAGGVIRWYENKGPARASTAGGR